MTDALLIVRPTVVTDGILIGTNVPETDHAAYSGSTVYALGDRCIDAHKVYESLAASNTGNALSDPSKWAEVSATNRWRVFDASNSSQTAQATLISYTLRPGMAVTSFGALNLTGATSLRLRLIDQNYGTVYDKTTDLSAIPAAADWWSWFFGLRTAPTLSIASDLPSFPWADLQIDLSGGADLAVGMILFGQSRPIGLGVQLGATVGIQDYSRKETNDFGDTVLTQRAFAKRASFAVPIPASQVDAALTFLSSLRAVPCLWIGSGTYESTVIFGFYKDFNVSIAYSTISDCSIEIEGLT